MFSFDMFSFRAPFDTQYRCYSISMLPGNERHDVEKGGKIIMPPSALDHLSRMSVVYPMLFKLTNKKTNSITHCGVLEFVADEGKVYLPYWMMRNLLLEEGELVNVQTATLPVATYSKFEPQSTDFLEITDPTAVLENALRNFACLTTGDCIAIEYNNRIYELCVLETKPHNAVTIIECDMNVEFSAPVGYKDPEPMQTVKENVENTIPNELMPLPDLMSFVAFSGEGVRLDGKKKKAGNVADAPLNIPPLKRGIPDYNYELGTLKFIRVEKVDETKKETETKGFEAFSGEGQSLRKHPR